jgi:hypothetical protein
MAIGVARSAPPHVFVVDTVAPLSEEALRAMRDDPLTPVRGVAIYLGEGDMKSKRDAAFAAGLFVTLVTFSRRAGWGGTSPSRELGQADGATDVRHLLDLEAPSGVTAWTDLEGCPGNAADTGDWCNARGEVQRQAGWDPGLYVGAVQPMNGIQLGLLVQNRYWQSLSRLVTASSPPGYVVEPAPGWCMRQLPRTRTLCGVEVDVDVTQYDWKDRLPVVWYAEP